MPSLPRQFRRTGQVALAIGSLLLLVGLGGLLAMGSGSSARVAPARTSSTRIAVQSERPVPEPPPIEARYVPPSIAPSPPATHQPVRPSAPQSSAPQPQPQPQPQPCPFHWPIFRDWCHRHGFQPPQ